MKHVYILKIFLLLTIFIHEKTMSQEITISKQYIKVEMTDAISDISINGVPFIKNLDTDGLVTTEPVNLWLRNGENTISYSIYPHEESTGYSPKLSASIFLHDDKQEMPTPLKILATIEHTSDPEVKYPFTKSIKFNINNKIFTKLWDDAETINSINSQDKAQMIQLANKLANSVLNNTKQAVDLQLYKIQEDALSEGKTVDRLKEVAAKSYEWLQKQENLKIDEIDPDEIKFNICGSGQLINMTRKNNEDAIIIESEDMYFDIGLYFARIKGNWTIVR